MNERVTQWFKFTEEDLQSAKVLLRENIYNKVCFHSQQSVENGLKGLLVSYRRFPPKTHSLIELLRLILPIHPKLQEFEEACRHLDLFYLPTRYADALVGTLPEGLPTEKHAIEALKSAESFLEEVKKLLQ